jgi:hypothetical protein
MGPEWGSEPGSDKDRVRHQHWRELNWEKTFALPGGMSSGSESCGFLCWYPRDHGILRKGLVLLVSRTPEMTDRAKTIYCSAHWIILQDTSHHSACQ